MKILFHTYSLAFQNPGGGERVLLDLAAELRQRGHQVDLYSTLEQNPADYDLLHYFSSLEDDYWAYWKRGFPSKPLIVTPTIYQAPNMASTWQAWKRRLRWSIAGRGRNPFAQVDLFLPTTDGEAKALQRFYSVEAERIEVFPNGVSAQFLSGDAELFRRHVGIPGPYILHVGRFHPVKNQLSLIRATRSLDIPLVLIGDPDPAAPEYYQQCRAEAFSSERVRFVGALAHADPLLAGAYAGAEIFCLPSDFETFGIAALEAALAGTKLVLTENLGAKYLLGGKASFFNPKSAEDLRRTLAQSLTEKREWPFEERQVFAGELGWARLAERLDAIYRKRLKQS